MAASSPASDSSYRDEDHPSPSSSGSHDNIDSTPHQPDLDVPPRPTRSEYAAYAAMVRDLAEAEEGNLARQLLQPQPLSGIDSRLAEDTQERPSGPSSVRSRAGSITGSRRVKPARIQQVNPQGITTTRTLTTAWPLQLDDLPRAIPDLEESVLAFATSYIRRQGLVHPFAGRSHTKRSLGTEDLEYVLPDLVKSTREVIEAELRMLASVRPLEVRRKREKLGKLDWRSVICGASVNTQRSSVVSKSNARLRKLYDIDGEDIIAHRMRIIAEANAHRKASLAASLYAGVVDWKPSNPRRHQSKQELAERERKRKARLEAKRKSVTVNT